MYLGMSLSLQLLLVATQRNSAVQEPTRNSGRDKLSVGQGVSIASVASRCPCRRIWNLWVVLSLAEHISTKISAILYSF